MPRRMPAAKARPASPRESRPASAPASRTSSPPSSQAPKSRAAAGSAAKSCPARSSPRLKLEQVTCELSGSQQAEVMDLSRGGMCVRGESLELNQLHECVLSGFGSSAGPIVARVVWSKAVDQRTHDIGLQFVALTAQQASEITTLAMLGRQRRCFVSQ